jgi:hypothetical protein
MRPKLTTIADAGYCDKKGCKNALSPLPFPNGITNVSAGNVPE